LVVLKKWYWLAGVQVLNIGKDLAKVVKPMKRRPEIHFQFSVQEAVINIIREHTNIDPSFGEYVVIANPGILFEPELGIDVVELLRRVSKNTLTILLWPGEASKQMLWFLREGSEHRINYSDINYIIL
jgi:hypothetical protein